MQPKFQTLAADGGPQARDAQAYADAIPGAIAAVRARAGKKSAGSRCDDLNSRAQLGETLTETQLAYLKNGCH